MGEFKELDEIRATRLAALDELDILDTAPEAEFDDTVHLASALCRTPIALVTLLTDNRQWFKARLGLDAEETPFEQSVCRYTLSAPDLLIVPDLSQDPRTAQITSVAQADGLRFYAGAPLKTRTGVPIGSVCVVDTKPRPEGLTRSQMVALRALARHTTTLLEDRRSGARQEPEGRNLLGAIAEAVEEEHRLAELRERFVAVLGHDLRNPLTAISAGFRILERDPSGANTQDLLPLMKQSVARMTELVESTLDFARIRLSGGMDLYRRTGVTLQPVLEHVVAEARTSHPDCLIVARFDLNKPVDCDPDRLGQMLSNLLANAITHGDASQPIEVVTTTRSGEFILWVANRGDAITPETQAEMFEPFVRGAKPGQKGLGLGLYIAAEIARAHHGSLSVVSTSEHTRFVFRMPLLGR